MADTSYLKTVVEDYVRKELENRLGVPFESQSLTLSTGGTHEFDAVSSDRKVVASIKSASGRTSGGKIPSGKIKDSIAEIYFLSLVSAPKKLLVLTSPEFFEILSKTLEGQLVPSVSLELVKLPADIQQKVDRIKEIASREVSGDSMQSKKGPHQSTRETP